MAASRWPTNSKELGEYFWKSTENRETIIRKINQTCTPSKMKVRLERYGPYIYGVIVNKPEVVIHTTDGNTVSMKLMKIGFTHADTSSEVDDNRIATVKTAAENKLKSAWSLATDVSVIFVLPIDALDTRCFFDVESEVREKCGIVLPKEFGKKLHLPVHTEWVVTTDEFVKEIRKKIKERKENNSRARKLLPATNTPRQTRGPAAKNVETPASDGSGTTTPKSTPRIRQPQPAGATNTTSDTGLEELFESALQLCVQMIDTKSVFNELNFDKKSQCSVAVCDFLAKSAKSITIERNEDDKKLHLQLISQA